MANSYVSYGIMVFNSLDLDQCVTIDNHKVRILTGLSVVTQGSILVPTLFIFINDLPVSQSLFKTKRYPYLSLVRSYLVYCSKVWKPLHLGNTMMLEKFGEPRSLFLMIIDQRLTDIQLLPLMMIFELNDIGSLSGRSNFHLATLIF